MEFKLINPKIGLDKTFSATIIASFLHKHLEQFADKTEDINNKLSRVASQGLSSTTPNK